MSRFGIPSGRALEYLSASLLISLGAFAPAATTHIEDQVFTMPFDQRLIVDFLSEGAGSSCTMGWFYFDVDTDGDGIPNFLETGPNDDLDGDSLINSADPDDDGDGILDALDNAAGSGLTGSLMPADAFRNGTAAAAAGFHIGDYMQWIPTDQTGGFYTDPSVNLVIDSDTNGIPDVLEYAVGPNVSPPMALDNSFTTTHNVLGVGFPGLLGLSANTGQYPGDIIFKLMDDDGGTFQTGDFNNSPYSGTISDTSGATDGAPDYLLYGTTNPANLSVPRVLVNPDGTFLEDGNSSDVYRYRYVGPMVSSQREMVFFTTIYYNSGGSNVNTYYSKGHLNRDAAPTSPFPNGVTTGDDYGETIAGFGNNDFPQYRNTADHNTLASAYTNGVITTWAGIATAPTDGTSPVAVLPADQPWVDLWENWREDRRVLQYRGIDDWFSATAVDAANLVNLRYGIDLSTNTDSFLIRAAENQSHHLTIVDLQAAEGIILVGIEDIFASGDRDYEDIVVALITSQVAVDDLMTTVGSPTITGTYDGSVTSIGITILDSLGATAETGAATLSGGNWNYSTSLGDGIYNVVALTDTGATDATTSELIIDSTNPVATTPTDAGVVSSNPVVFSWTAPTDATSGIASVVLQVGTTPGGNDVFDGDVTGNTSQNITGTDTDTLYARLIVTDVAGNSVTTGNSDGILVDLTPPVAPTGLDLASGDDSGSSNSDNITNQATNLTLSGTAEAGSNVELFDGATSLGTFTAAAFATGVDVALAEGPHNITAVATDAAGNTGAASAILTINVDTTPPAAPTGLDLSAADDSGASSADDITFNGTNLTISGSAEAGSSVELFDGATPLSTLTAAAFATGADFTLSEASHPITAQATDVAGNTGLASAVLTVLVDRTDPVASAPTDAGAFTGNTTVTFNWAAPSDASSGVSTSVLQVGTTPGGNDIFDADVTALTTQDVTGANGQTLYARLIVTDIAGNQNTTGNSDGILVDTGLPVVTAPTDAGVYTNNGTVAFNWALPTDAESSITTTTLVVGTTPGGNENSQNDVLSLTTANATGLNGETLYAYLLAGDSAGNVESSSVTDGITIDLDDPIASAPTDAGAITNDANVTFSWTAPTDAISGVASTVLQVGTTPGGNDVFDAAVVGTSQVAVGTNGNTLYGRLVVTDNAGNITTTGNSDGILVDTGLPVVTAPTDAGVYTNNGTVAFNWALPTDAESSITTTTLVVGTTSGGNENTESDVLSLTTANATGSNGETLYAYLLAGDTAGNVESSSVSDGITIDLDDPIASVPTDAGVYTNNATVTFSWAAPTDPISGIATAVLQVGTTPGGNDVFDADVTALTTQNVTGSDGDTLYARLVVTDNAGNIATTGNSDGILVDLTDPVASAPTDSGAITNDVNVTFSWTATTDATSGVASTVLQVGTTPGGNDVFDAAVVGTSQVVAGANDDTLYGRLVVTDNAGNVTTTGNSDGILVDTGLPVVSAPTDAGVYTNNGTVAFNWALPTDAESSITTTTLVVGTTPGGNENSQNDVLSLTTANATGNSGDTLYAFILAGDEAGNVSSSAVSDGITIDLDDPLMSTPVDEGDTTNNANVTFTWASPTDAISGINSVTLNVGTTPGGSDVFSGDVTALTSQVATGSDGDVLYAQLIATDNAGNIGTSGISDGILIDLGAPTAPTPTDAGAYSQSPLITFNWVAPTDAANPITTTTLVVGTTPGGSEVGSYDVLSLTTFDVLGSENDTLYAYLDVFDSAGNQAISGNSDGILIDTIAPSIGAPADEGATTLNNNTQFTWTVAADGGSGLAATLDVIVGSTPGGNDVATLNVPATNTNAVLAGLNDGDLVYGYVQVADLAGNVTTTANTDGIIIDLTPPTAFAPTDAGVWSTTDTVTFNWVAPSDIATTITVTNLVVGTTPGGSDIATLDGLGATSLDVSGLDGQTLYAFLDVTDAAGRTTTTGVSDGITIDLTPPVAIVDLDLDDANDSGASNSDNVTNETNLTFSGTAEANSIVTFLVDGGTSNTVTAAAFATGITDTFAEGSYSITTIVTDEAGNVGPESAPLLLVVDLTAPTITSPDLLAADDTGLLDNDNITSLNSLRFDLVTEVGAEVELLQGVSIVATGTGSGTYLDAGPLLDGPYVYTSRATDLAGNVGTSLIPLAVLIDSVDPIAPSTPDLIAADDSGISNSDNVTNVASPSFDILVGGVLDTIQLLRDGTPVNSMIGPGTIAEPGPLADGTYDFTARALDTAGNSTDSATTLTIVVDTTPPSVPNAPDLFDANDSGPFNNDDYTTQTLFSFNVVADAGEVTELLRDTVVIDSGIGSGVYTDTAPALDGVYTYTLRSRDIAGNTSADSVATIVTVDNTQPNLVIDPVTPNPAVSGVASIDLLFDEAAFMVDFSLLTLTRDGGANLLTAANTVTTDTLQVVHTINALSALTEPYGDYVLTVPAEAFVDFAGNHPAAAQVEMWRRDAPPTTIGLPDLTVDEEDIIPAIDLTMYFDDVEDGAAGLTYGINNITNPTFLSTATVTPPGDLNLGLLADQFGVTEINIQALDTAGQTITTTFTLTVNNVNDAPADIDLTPSSVAEYAPYDYLVGTLSTTDVDPMDSHSYTLLTQVDRFAIVGDELRVRGTLDATAYPTITVRVRTTDNGTPNLSYEEDIVVTLIPGNKPPTDILLSNNIIPETAGMNTVIGTLSSIDPNPGDSHSYTIVYDESGFGLGIDGNNLVVRNEASLDFDQDREIDVFIRTTDDGSPFNLSFIKYFVIELTDENDLPSLVRNEPFTVLKLGSGVLNSSRLEIYDQDNNIAENFYQLKTVPQQGRLFLNLSSVPVELEVGDRFTQLQLNLGLVTYVHEVNDPFQQDGFEFYIGDPVAGTVFTPSYSFQIFTTLANTPPTLVNNSNLTVDSFTTYVVSSGDLLMVDAEQPTSELTYILATLPMEGVFFRNNSPIDVGGFFTQADVDSNSVTYRTDTTTAVADSFQFVYTDNITPGASTVVDGTITINSTANSDPYLDPLSTLMATIPINGQVTITNGLLRAKDDEQSADQVIIRIIDEPLYGSINLSTQSRVLIRAADSFTMEEILLNKVKYVHNGTVVAQDTFTFQIEDGIAPPVGPFTFTVFFFNEVDDWKEY